MEKLPTELILEQLSFMDNTSIKNFCKSNRKIYNICKNNKNFLKKIYYNNILTKESLKYYHNDIRKQYLELNKYKNKIEQINDKGYPTLYYILQRCIVEKFYDMIYILINSLDDCEKNIFIEQSNNKEYNRNWTHPILESIQRVPEQDKDDKKFLKLVKNYLNIIYFLCKFYNCNNINLINEIIYKLKSDKLDEDYISDELLPKYMHNKYRYQEFIIDKIKYLSYNITTNTLYYKSESGSENDSDSSDSN
jgi:hypothetical protein